MPSRDVGDVLCGVSVAARGGSSQPEQLLGGPAGVRPYLPVSAATSRRAPRRVEQRIERGDVVEDGLVALRVGDDRGGARGG